MENWRVLIVEDDPDGQELVERMLKHHKIQTDVVHDAEAALRQLHETTYTGVIIDLSLPGMNGWTLLETIHSNEQTNDLPCIAITAFHSPEVAVAAKEAGFAGYFAKPLETARLIREMQEIFTTS